MQSNIEQLSQTLGTTRDELSNTQNELSITQELLTRKELELQDETTSLAGEITYLTQQLNSELNERDSLLKQIEDAKEESRLQLKKQSNAYKDLKKQLHQAQKKVWSFDGFVGSPK